MTTEKIQPVELCSAIGKCQSSPSGYASYMGTSRFSHTPSATAVADHALRQLEAARAADIATHEKNLPAIEANKAIAVRIEALMVEIGMPRSWSERDTKSRSRYPKTVTHEAGWLADIRRNCRTDDSFAYATATYERMLPIYTDYKARAEKEAAHAAGQRQRDEEAALEKRKADMELAAVLLRYEMPITSDWSDVLDALTAKNQRLRLAVAMQRTRNDWSEGPYRVRGALSAFQVETTEDKDIANDVLSCLEDFDDGRVFRDTTWSYDALFASVQDSQLVADVHLALQRTST